MNVVTILYSSFSCPTYVNRKHPGTGLTLVELVVVLVILAILATVAVSTVAPRVDQSRFEGTQQLVQEVNDAILNQQTNTNGAVFPTGFVVDMGGLPVAITEADSSLSLRQLFENVVNTGSPPASFSIRTATGVSVANTTDSDGQTVVADQEVLVGSGWRGPYLKLAIGASSLKDSWGNLLRSNLATATHGSDSHLRQAGDLDVLAAGDSIIGIRSLGKDDQPGGTGYDADLPAVQLNDSQFFGTVTGTVMISDTVSATASQIIVQIYYPDRETGLIRIERANVTGPTSNGSGFDVFSFEFKTSGGNHVSFPVGPRALRAYYDLTPDNSGDFSDNTDDPQKSPIQNLNILPTTNHVQDLPISN